MNATLRLVTHAEQWTGQLHPRVWHRWWSKRPFIMIDLSGGGCASRDLAHGDWILSHPHPALPSYVRYWVVSDHEFKRFYRLEPDGSCTRP